ncbi:type VI secretion system Hcp family effector [Providencia alcalifaciens]|nr:type VI secretion system Hcp family effector [Providencia alcalifaciens]
MAYPTYLTLKGKSQGLISAGCSSQDSIGNRYQVGHEDEIQVIGANYGSFREQNASYILKIIQISARRQMKIVGEHR